MAAAAAVALWFAVDPGSLRSRPLGPSAESRQVAAAPERADGPAGRAAPAPSLPAEPAAKAAAPGAGGDESRRSASVKPSAPSLADKKTEISQAAPQRPKEAGVPAPGAFRAPSPSPAPPPPASNLEKVARDAIAPEALAVAPALEIAPPSGRSRWRILAPARVARSIDAGATWTETELPAGAQVAAGASPADGVCWLVGANGLVLRTTDGVSWTRMPFPDSLPLVAIQSASPDSAVVTAADGRSFVTSDAGNTWISRQF